MQSGRWQNLIWLLVCGVLSSVWCLTAGRQIGATFDEPIYITRGLEGWRAGSHHGLLRLGTMPLPADGQTLPLYLWERVRGTPWDLDADFARRRHDFSGVLVHLDYVDDRSMGLTAGAVEEQPSSVPRPSRPSGLGAASQHRDPARRRIACRTPQPQVVGLLLVRMEGNPLAVRRPAERLILRRRVVDDVGRFSGWRCRIGRDDVGDQSLFILCRDHHRQAPVGMRRH